MHALRSYLKLISEYELRSLPNKRVSGAKDHGKNHIKIRPPLVRHLLRNRLLCLSIFLFFLSKLDIQKSYLKVDHSENKNVMQIKLCEREVEAAEQQSINGIAA